VIAHLRADPTGASGAAGGGGGATRYDSHGAPRHVKPRNLW